MTGNGYPRARSTAPFSGPARVNPVTGVLCLPEMDYGQWELGEPFRLERRYEVLQETRIPRFRIFGSRWRLGPGGQAVRDGDYLRLPIGQFLWEAFSFRDGRWTHSGGNPLLALTEHRDGYTLKDARVPAEYEYDSQGRLLSVRKRGGFPLRFVLQGSTLDRIVLPSGLELRATCQDGRLVRLVDVLGRELSYEYDGPLLVRATCANRASIRYAYDERGLLTSCTDRNGTRTLQLAYDDYGRVIRQTGASGAVYEFLYEDQDRRTIIRERGTGRRRMYCWNRKKQVCRIAYEDGTEELFSYDGSGHLVSRKDRAGRETCWEYLDGLLAEKRLPGGFWVRFGYDELQRLVTQTDSQGGEVHYAYSSSGWVVERRIRLGERAWSCETLDRDLTGRILSYDRNGNKLHYAYEERCPLPSMVETPCGDKFSYRYDKAFRLLAIRSASGERKFGYNALDLLASDEDALGSRRIYRYDLQGMPLGPAPDLPEIFWEPQPVTKETGEAYKPRGDAPGAVQEKRDEEGRLLSCIRYDLGRRKLEERIVREEPGGNPARPYRLARWKYDENGNPLEIRTWLDGQDETSATGRIHILRCRYDAQDRLVSSEDNKGRRMEYAYDSLGRCVLEKRREPAGPVQVARYFYDPAGRLVGHDEKSDYARTGRLWEHTQFELDMEGACIAATLPDGQALGRQEASARYAECLGRLPRYEDCSGYCREERPDGCREESPPDGAGSMDTFPYWTVDDMTR